MTTTAPRPGAPEGDQLPLSVLERCFTGVIPAIIATASADGTPNVTYLSRCHAVDDERLALSNQFFSKTARNLAENPRASMLIIDPVTHDEYRLDLAYERTERRGELFDRLAADVVAIAAMTGMQDVFRLRAADIYRVTSLVATPVNPDAPPPPEGSRPGPGTVAVGEMCSRIARCPDLESLVATLVDGLDRVLGYHHVHLLLAAEDGRSLYTMASRGFDAESVGAEVAMGDGVIGMAAQRGEPVRVGNLGQMSKYSRTVQRSWEDHGGEGAAPAVPMPGLPGAHSRVAVPAFALGQLVGVLSADSRDKVAFGPADEAALSVVASLFASAYETLRAEERAADPTLPGATPAGGAAPDDRAPVRVRHFAVDGSTFLDGEYLIKGVAGRILWALLGEHDRNGRTEFTNKELRLDPSLDMPGFKDNLESRLILLKRRLDEREAAIRMTRTGRGRFRLEVERPVRLDPVVDA